MRYQKYFWAIYCICFGLWGSISAQSYCGTIGPNPILYPVNDSPFFKSVITIPIVFHVLYDNAADSISIAQIDSQIEVLNEDFRATNTDLTNVIFAFRSHVADMEINFVRATVQPDGQPTSGVLYRDVSDRPRPFGEYIVGNRRASCYTELGGSDAWCTDCYLNVWVVRNSIFAGKAILPTQIGVDVPRAEDGIYINPDRLGKIGTVTPPYHLGRTLTHEVGHYLNLYHLWGTASPNLNCNDNACCSAEYDDGVADTPAQCKTYLGECPVGGTPNSCTCSFRDTSDNYQNFMTFANDACLLMFTEGQKTRVRASIQQYRPGLLNQDCIVQCVSSVHRQEKLPGNVWVSQSTLWLEGIPKGVSLQWRTLTGQILMSWENPGPQRYMQTFAKMPTGLYILTWQWQGRSAGNLLHWY